MIDPEKAYQFHLKAEAAAEMRQLELAQDHAAQALSLCPDEPDYHASLARMCLGLEQLADAERHCLAGLERDAEHLWLLRILVIVTRFRGKYEESLTHAKRLVALDPLDWRSHYEIGKTYLELGKPSIAITHCTEALSLDPENGKAKMTLGNCYLDLEKPALAEQQYREALAETPNDAETLNNLGVSLLRQDKVKDAALAFKAALVLNPELTVAKSNMKKSIGNYLSVGGGVSAFMILSALGKVAFFGGREFSAEQMLLIGTTIAVCGITLFAVCAIAIKWKRKRELLKADPQLLQIYKAVCEEANVE